MTAETSTTQERRRARARREAALFGAVVTLTDLLPPRIRYGYVHRLTGRVLGRPLAGLAAAVPSAAPMPLPVTARDRGLRCGMLAGALDVGGIGAVVELLAAAFPAAGVTPVVVCSVDGARAERLRSHGVEVAIAATEADAHRVLRELALDAIELHGAPAHLEEAAIASGIPVIPVLHNTEIHYTPARWRRFARVLGHAVAAVAVSESVREFHARHVPAELAARIRVVANAVPSPGAPTPDDRRAARAALGRTVGADLADDVVLVSLARYDAQKNIAGLVASFLAHSADDRVRLVVAGEPSDWAEWRRADALRRCRPGADRVSLLGRSDARTLLAAADGFVLDSFFEGWPVAATEAAAAGLGLVLADVGGARELVGRDPGHSVLIANPCGPAAAVSDSAVARARRNCARQPNAAELGAAVDAFARRVCAGERPLPQDADALMAAMVEGHAAVLRGAAAQAPEAPRNEAAPRNERVAWGRR
ncbi:glycosyltransferase [Leifsonia shinshuensis]|uniref:Glycosyltransferase involved in cell wall biosynthesis n=1 Tax=Leifsonia shinshuensis TaxID=150026 RepID=A0A853CQ86_9MICO|nr:glycosyltransferase [Leifsonia shinshuensis]NYJ22582.1 glycosyltransferase involved in cell wall biosynthesis [Leifsonia shinshuensis]